MQRKDTEYPQAKDTDRKRNQSCQHFDLGFKHPELQETNFCNSNHLVCFILFWRS